VNVELIGLPGTGKSYVCHQLSDLVSQNEYIVTGNRVDNQMRLVSLGLKTYHALIFVLPNPRKAIHITKTVFQTTQRSRIQKVTKLINLLSELGRSQKTKINQLMISEQGVLQAIWSLQLHASQSIFHDLLVVCKDWLPSAAIMVRSPSTEVNCLRLRSRVNGQSRFDRMNLEELTAELERGERLWQDVKQDLDSVSPQLEWVEFINSEKDSSRSLAEWISRYANQNV